MSGSDLDMTRKGWGFTDPEHARPVWLTRGQRDVLADWTYDDESGVPQVVAAWDAAPADPAEAIAKLLARDWYGEEWCDLDDETRLDHFEKARDVLRALGHSCPD